MVLDVVDVEKFVDFIHKYDLDIDKDTYTIMKPNKTWIKDLSSRHNFWSNNVLNRETLIQGVYPLMDKGSYYEFSISQCLNFLLGLENKINNI